MDETHHLSNPKNSPKKIFRVTSRTSFFLKNEINSRQIKQKISQNSSTLTQQKQQIAAEHRNNQRGYSKQEHNTNRKPLQNTQTILLLH